MIREVCFNLNPNSKTVQISTSLVTRETLYCQYLGSQEPNWLTKSWRVIGKVKLTFQNSVNWTAWFLVPYLFTSIKFTQGISKGEQLEKHGKKEEEQLTYRHKRMQIMTIRFPKSWLNSFLRLWHTKTQNRVTGVRIRDSVRNIDRTSGPNASLPPKQNFCNITTQHISSHCQQTITS